MHTNLNKAPPLFSPRYLYQAPTNPLKLESSSFLYASMKHVYFLVNLRIYMNSKNLKQFISFRMNTNHHKNTFHNISSICVSTGSFASRRDACYHSGERCCFCPYKTLPVRVVDLRDYDGELGESGFLAYIAALYGMGRENRNADNAWLSLLVIVQLFFFSEIINLFISTLNAFFSLSLFLIDSL